jgi:type III pantothenate kinase
VDRLLVLDVANATTAVGVFAGERLAARWRLSSDPRRTPDEYGLLLRQLLATLDGEPPRGAVLGSVVPALTPSLCRACRDHVGVEPLVVGPGVRSGVAIRTDNPRELGADRIANALAARALHGVPAIVADFATATTFDVVGAAGDYLGAVIAPGLEISAQALARQTAQLQVVELSRPARVVGRSSATAVQSGLIHGFAGLVEGVVARVRAELRAPARVVATGPLAEAVAAATRVIDAVDPELTLQGLRLLWELNNG